MWRRSRQFPMAFRELPHCCSVCFFVDASGQAMPGTRSCHGLQQCQLRLGGSMAHGSVADGIDVEVVVPDARHRDAEELDPDMEGCSGMS